MRVTSGGAAPLARPAPTRRRVADLCHPCVGIASVGTQPRLGSPRLHCAPLRSSKGQPPRGVWAVDVRSPFGRWGPGRWGLPESDARLWGLVWRFGFQTLEGGVNMVIERVFANVGDLTLEIFWESIGWQLTFILQSHAIWVPFATLNDFALLLASTAVQSCNGFAEEHTLWKLQPLGRLVYVNVLSSQEQGSEGSTLPGSITVSIVLFFEVERPRMLRPTMRSKRPCAQLLGIQNRNFLKPWRWPSRSLPYVTLNLLPRRIGDPMIHDCHAGLAICVEIEYNPKVSEPNFCMFIFRY